VNNYLLTLLVKNDVEEKDRLALLDNVKKAFGKLDKEDLWGVRELAYPISKQNRAFYAHFEFQSEPNTISQLDKNLKLNEDVIRYLIVRNDPKKAKKKVTKKEEVKAEEKAE